MLNKILCVIALGLLVGWGDLRAQAPAGDAKIKGRIIAARVEGTVTVVSKSGGESRVLHEKDTLTDGTRVITAPGASVILIFSNGASVNVAPDSTLDIDEFEQDPFASDVKVAELRQEPTTSVTKLSIAKGELVGKVVHLNIDKGSEFTVQTPVGAAGIRGTTFRIVFRPSKDGKSYRFSLTTADGRVVFTGRTSAPLEIPAGKQVVVDFEASGDLFNPLTSVQVTDAFGMDIADIESIAQQIQTFTATTIFLAPQGSGPGGPKPVVPHSQASGSDQSPQDTPVPPPVIPPVQPTPTPVDPVTGSGP